jgi:hypothetical protein
MVNLAGQSCCHPRVSLLCSLAAHICERWRRRATFTAKNKHIERHAPIVIEPSEDSVEQPPDAANEVVEDASGPASSDAPERMPSWTS